MLLATSLYEGWIAYRKENKFQKTWGNKSEGHREITYIARDTENTKLPSIPEFLLRALYILSIKYVLYSY